MKIKAIFNSKSILDIKTLDVKEFTVAACLEAFFSEPDNRPDLEATGDGATNDPDVLLIDMDWYILTFVKI